jgi:putative redox protein
MSDQWKEVNAAWEGAMVFTGRNASGGSVQIGSWEDRPGIGPMEMLLLGVAGCTGMDVISILNKKRQVVRDLKVEVRGRRAEDYPRIFKEIEISYLLWGDDIDPKAVERAIELSETRYCSASAMMKNIAEIRSTFQIFSLQENLS